jgi:hypothetical protein
MAQETQSPIIHGALTCPHGTSVDWSVAPELWTLPECVAITRHSIGHAHNLLYRGQFPILPLPDVRPYRFPKAHVRAWVEHGTITNPSLAATMRARRRARRRKAA